MDLWMQREIRYMECPEDGGVETLQVVATRTPKRLVEL